MGAMNVVFAGVVAGAVTGICEEPAPTWLSPVSSGLPLLLEGQGDERFDIYKQWKLVCCLIYCLTHCSLMV